MSTRLSTFPHPSRRVFLRVFGLGAGASLLAACAPTPAAPAPTTAPPKPGAPSPATSPATKSAASPVASPSVVAAGSPAASPAAKPSAVPTVDPSLASVWQGKTMTATVGFAAGGGNDTWTRLFARHLPKHLPGAPAIVVQNVVGAGSLIQVNQLYEAKPDGLTFGNIERGMPTFQVRGEEGVRFDATKLGWMGSLTQEAYFFIIHSRAGITDLRQLESKTIRVGLLTPGDFSHNLVVVLRDTLGWKLDSVFGYKGQSDVLLAIDRGDVDAVPISWSSIVVQKRDELQNKTLVPAVRMGVDITDPLARDVPTAVSLFRDKPEEAKQLLALAERPLRWSRSFAAPPGLDPKVLGGLRAGLLATAADADFVAEAERLKLDVIPLPGDQTQELITSYVQTPKSVFDRLETLITNDSPR